MERKYIKNQKTQDPIAQDQKMKLKNNIEKIMKQPKLNLLTRGLG